MFENCHCGRNADGLSNLFRNDISKAKSHEEASPSTDA